MLKTEIVHPDLLQALAEAGHGARILLADGNYPVTVRSNPLARRVFLNLRPGLIGGVEILRSLAITLPFESALYMATVDNRMPEIVGEYQKILGHDVPFEARERFAFYDEASSPLTSLVIATGESLPRANLLLTVGVVRP